MCFARWGVAAVVLTVLEVVVWRFIRSRGAGLSGDEPHYLVLARMLGHGSLHPLTFYKTDVTTHSLYGWPPGLLARAVVDPASWHAFRGPHGLVTVHGLGVPALIAPFVAVAGRTGGIIGLVALQAVGWVYLFARATDLAGLRRPARVVTALAMAAPAVWIAATQLYPDFVAGLLIAIAVVEVARIERTGRLDGAGVTALAVSLGLLPWLHIKDLAPAALVLAAMALVAGRSRQWSRAGIAVGFVALSWLMLLLYNLYAFGRPLGYPQPSPTPTWAALTHGLGLLFDRHHGLVIQVPTVILALLGLWVARRVVPVAVTTSVATILILVYLNATYIGVPYGGTALAGRFSWSYIAPLLVWLPFLLVTLEPIRRLWAVGAAMIVAWVLQAIPILAGHHVYYNTQLPGAPWDPSLYPGWWGPVNRLLPELAPKGRVVGTPPYALAVAILISIAIAVTVVLTRRVRSHRSIALAIGFTFSAVALVAVASITPAPLPSKALTFPGTVLGSPLTAGPTTVTTAPVPLQGVGAGTFTLTFSYQLRGSGAGTAYCTTGTTTTPGRPTSLATRSLEPGAAMVAIVLHCPAGLIWTNATARPGSTLAIAMLTVRKIAN
jgi:hypothetical protein